MEIAQNYWDKMGNGNFEEMHTYLFGMAVKELGVTSAAYLDSLQEGLVTETPIQEEANGEMEC